MATKKKSAKYPSYEDGELRDPKITAIQDPNFTSAHLAKLVKKAIKRPKSG